MSTLMRGLDLRRKFVFGEFFLRVIEFQVCHCWLTQRAAGIDVGGRKMGDERENHADGGPL